jgi:gluconate 5-dehydrogenase
MKNIFDISGKVAVVTGASSGLGAHFATILAENGADVAILARRTEKLADLEKTLLALGGRVLSVKCDVTNPEQVDEAVKAIIKQFKKIDILVNNAGVASVGRTEDSPLENWTKVIDTNLNGTYYMSRAVGRHMIARKYGKIINMGSIHSRVAMPGMPIPAYTASKGGVLMLTKELAAEWADNGITVNALGPSYFPSEMTASGLASPEFVEKIAKLCPMGRPGKIEELDGALLYFASDASSFTTGQLLNIDCGWTAI